ncbi:MAG: TfoX/Sxy family protein [Candidatus Dormibacteria bacterium]
MAHDEELADRLRKVLAAEPAVTEKRMFGGVAFLVHGNMAVSASGRGGLMVRVDPADGESLIQTEGVEAMEMRGREMPGWLRVGAQFVGTEPKLRAWVDRGVTYARSLPPK